MDTGYVLRMISRRLANGLSILNVGDDRTQTKIAYALEAHRLMEYCPLVNIRYIFRTIFFKHQKNTAEKFQIKALYDFYVLFEQVMDGYNWPAPRIPNNVHDCIRMKLVETNNLIQQRIDGVTKSPNKMVASAASDEAKLLIKENDERRKQEERAKTLEKKRQELESIRAKAKSRQKTIVKKTSASSAERQRGHKLRIEPGKETRCNASRLLNEKILALYREKHGHDTDHMSREERHELAAIIGKESKEAKSAALREKTAERLQLKQDSLTNRVCHKVRLSLNNKQRTYIDKCIGISRFTYNWAIRQWLEARENGKTVYAAELSEQFTELSKTDYPFTRKVTHFARLSGFKSFSAAIDKFITRGWFPSTHKRKGIGSFSYVVTNERKLPFLSDSNPDIPDSKPSKKRQYLLIPTFGYVKTMQKLRFNGLLSYVTIKREADGHYYACLYVHVSHEEWQSKHRGCNPERATIDQPLGIDLGLSAYATLSDGTKIENREEDAKTLVRQKKLQARIHRCAKAHPQHTSKRQKRMALQLGRAKAKIRHQREDYLHKLSSALAYTYNNIAIEDLNIKAMLKENEDMAFKVRNAAFYRFRKMLEQKMAIVGGNLKVAEKFHPSTRTCSVCGNVREKALPMTQRTYHCEACGAVIDRDLNSAVNLARLLGLGEPNYPPADKGTLTTVLQASGISVHQAKDESR